MWASYRRQQEAYLRKRQEDRIRKGYDNNDHGDGKFKLPPKQLTLMQNLIAIIVMITITINIINIIAKEDHVEPVQIPMISEAQIRAKLASLQLQEQRLSTGADAGSSSKVGSTDSVGGTAAVPYKIGNEWFFGKARVGTREGSRCRISETNGVWFCTIVVD